MPPGHSRSGPRPPLRITFAERLLPTKIDKSREPFFAGSTAYQRGEGVRATGGVPPDRPRSRGVSLTLVGPGRHTASSAPRCGLPARGQRTSPCAAAKSSSRWVCHPASAVATSSVRPAGMVWVSSTREPRVGSMTISHRTTSAGYPGCFHSCSNRCGASAAVTFPADTSRPGRGRCAAEGGVRPDRCQPQPRSAARAAARVGRVVPWPARSEGTAAAIVSSCSVSTRGWRCCSRRPPAPIHSRAVAAGSSLHRGVVWHTTSFLSTFAINRRWCNVSLTGSGTPIRLRTYRTLLCFIDIDNSGLGRVDATGHFLQKVSCTSPVLANLRARPYAWAFRRCVQAYC